MIKHVCIGLLLCVGICVSALEILDVSYGNGGRRVDVTKQFGKLRRNDELYCGVIDGNRMAGTDPAPGVAKTLRVRYRDNDGTERMMEMPERGYCGISAGVPVSEEFRFGRAWFGSGDKYIDVSDAVGKLIAAGKEVTLDLGTLGVPAASDPAPGKSKEILIFHSIDNELRCAFYRERDRLKVSELNFAFDPIPLAAELKSPFAGMELDRAVWQWSIPVADCVSGENGLAPVAYLYIPPETKKLRGVVVGQFNMLERPIMEHPVFREALRKLDYGCIWIAPSLYGSCFDFRDAKKSAVMDGMFKDLAAVSGYPELADSPFIGLGHSAMAAFPYQLALWRPERAIACISYDGSTPGMGWPHRYDNSDPLLNDETLPRLAGIPILIRDGEYSGGRDNRRPVLVRQRYPELLITLLSDPGSGHFDINDNVIGVIGEYMSRADRARRDPSGNLRPVKLESGWYMDFWRPNANPRALPAPVKDFKAFTGQYGKEENWVFDAAFAEVVGRHFSLYQGRKTQLLGYEQHGKVIQENPKLHAQARVAFTPEKDGQTVRLKGAFVDIVPQGRPERWSGRKAGETVGHGSDPENVRIFPVCGPVVRIDDEKMAVRFDRFGFTRSRRSGEIYMMAVHPGDDEYRRSVLQSVMMVPVNNDKGIRQRITFPPIPDQTAGSRSVRLTAYSNTGLPVEYFVNHGPAYIKDGELIFTEIPAGAKSPVEVKVTAYQYGIKDKVASAVPRTVAFKLSR